MPENPLPESIRRFLKVISVDEMWFKLLTDGDPLTQRDRRVNSLVPSNPRCVYCYTPFGGLGGALGRFGVYFMAAVNVLVQANAFIDKFVGDKVTPQFFPGYSGKEHARKAAETVQALVSATGHGQPGGPWVPVGVGVHTGTAWVGSTVGASGNGSDFTALGDNVNITARLASKAGVGEVLISEVTANAARIPVEGLEKRELKLKGKSGPFTVFVLPART
jgi:class 3 adenylate cyclase